MFASFFSFALGLARHGLLLSTQMYTAPYPLRVLLVYGFRMWDGFTQTVLKFSGCAVLNMLVYCREMCFRIAAETST